VNSTTYDYDAQDPNFISDLRASQESVRVVASWLASRGYETSVREIRERPSVAEMADYGDGGDIEIVQRIEVKQRKTLTFTDKEDFPYPSLIVDACHCFDRASPKPYAYFILNREMTVAFLVMSDTSKQWKRVTKLDRFKNRNRDFYECPLDLVRVVALGGS
jgi:hypothetical protein